VAHRAFAIVTAAMLTTGSVLVLRMVVRSTGHVAMVASMLIRQPHLVVRARAGR
jgi:hypothetical protein